MGDVVQWVDAIGSLSAALVALGTVIYFEILQPRLIKPRLDIEIEMAPPFCLKSPKSIRPISQATVASREEIFIADCYFLRFKVINKGKQRAENVEVFASSLSKQQADGLYKEVTSFLPMHLKWVDHSDIFMPMISPSRMYRYCNLAHIIDPKHRGSFVGEAGHRPNVSSDETIISFDTIHQPYTLSHLQPPGKYHLTIMIAASNSELIEKTLEINLTGKWFDEEQRMLEEGIGIRFA